MSSGPLGAVREQLDALSPRDRKLLTGLLLFFGVLLMLFVGMAARARLADKASRVQLARRALTSLQVDQQAYLEAQGRVDAARLQMKEFAGQAPDAFLEKTSSATGVRDSLSITKQGSEEVGGVLQTRYRAELKRVEYEKALEFLYSVETSGYPLSVDASQFKKRSAKEGVTVTVTLELTHYQLEDEED